MDITKNKNNKTTLEDASITARPQSAPENTSPSDLSPQSSLNSISWAASHFLLHPGARVAIAHCYKGRHALEFAQMSPRLKTIGLSSNSALTREASDKYRLSNLSFISEPTSFNEITPESYDGVLNSFNIHRIYSLAGYTRSRVTHYLKMQMAQLKTGGTTVIQGYISPDNDENKCVLIELSDYKSGAHSIDKMSDAELLIRFSQTARPLSRSGCKGFYLEELPKRIDRTRLFRLPFKWAQEFLLRKDRRDLWHEEIEMEYTPFTFERLKQETLKIGGRLVFYAPQWDTKIIEDNYKPRCRLFDENYEVIDYPATSYVAVIQKIDQPESVTLREYRTSEEKPYHLNIDHVKDEDNGRVYDLVSRPKQLIDIVPYRRTPDGRLTIYARDSYERPIVNTIPRTGKDLDGKYWSGHLIEPVSYEIELDAEFNSTFPQLEAIVKETTGLTLKENGKHFDGSGYYQSPLMINEKVQTIFVEVKNPGKNQITVKHFEDGFHEKGTVKALDAQSVLKAAHVGLLANSKLELATYELMNAKGVAPEVWIREKVTKVGDYQPKRRIKPDDLIKDLKSSKKSYKQTMRNGGTLSLQRSLFIEESSEEGETTGINAKNMEYAIPKDETLNVAVVLPLTHDKASGETLVGFQMVDYPVPNRLDGQSTQIDSPAFILPKEVKSLFDAKQYIAKKFGVKPENITQLGSSYFCDTGLMPQRIYPFAIASPAKEIPLLSDFIYAPIKQIAKISFKWCSPEKFMKMVAEALHSFGTFHDLSLAPGRDPIVKNLKKKPRFISREVNSKQKQQRDSQTSSKNTSPSNELK